MVSIKPWKRSWWDVTYQSDMYTLQSVHITNLVEQLLTVNFFKILNWRRGDFFVEPRKLWQKLSLYNECCKILNYLQTEGGCRGDEWTVYMLQLIFFSCRQNIKKKFFHRTKKNLKKVFYTNSFGQTDSLAVTSFG